MENCPECHNLLLELEEKYVCGKCQKFYTKDDLLGGHSLWYIDICKNPSIWFKEVFETFPSVIAHEYWRLYELLRMGQIYGASLQLRDVLEVIIKFPTLIATSYIYYKKTRNDIENKLIVNLLEKPLSLGDWLKIARDLSKSTDIDRDLQKLLMNVVGIYEKNEIVHWRNETIGHGALSFQMNSDSENFFEKSLKAIKTYMEECEEIYKKLSFQLDTESQSLLLYGKERARNLDLSSSSELFVVINHKKLRLYPYMLIEQKGIYFFDSYYIKKNRASLLNYPDGNKLNANTKINNDIQNIYRSFNKAGYFSNMENEQSIEDKSYAIEDERILKKLQEVDDFQNPTYLEEWIKSSIKKHPKGIFLLQMERGMGKTMFSRSLDEQSVHRIKLPGFTTRGYYINSGYSYKTSHFINTINDILKQDKHERLAIRTHYHISEEAENKKVEFAKLLTEYFHEHQKYPGCFSQNGLLLILDGLDEIPANEGVSIYDFIPDPSLLPENVYILLTSRINEELSPYNLSRLQALNVNEQINIGRNDPEYMETMKKYIISKILKENLSFKSMDQVKASLPSEKNFLIQVILQHSKQRFLYLKPLKELMMMDETIDLSLLPEGDGLFQYYFEKLEEMYGGKFFQKVIELAAILSTCYEPLTLKEIAHLMGDEYPTFRLLAYLNDLRGFIKVERNYRGNLYSISHEQWKNVVRKSYESSIPNLVNRWKEQCLTINEEAIENFQWADDNNDGLIYQLIYLKEYMFHFCPSEIPLLSTLEFCRYLNEIAINLYRYSIKIYQKQRSTMLFTEALTIIREAQQHGSFFDKELLAVILINQSVSSRALGVSKGILETENEAFSILMGLKKKNKLKDENYLAIAFSNRGETNSFLGYKKNALKDYNNSIKINRKLLSHGKLNDINDLASALMNRGIILNELGSSEEALLDYGEAIEIRRQLQATGISVENELALTLMNRGVALDNIGLKLEAIEDYNAAISILESFQKFEEHYEPNDLVGTLMNRGNIFSVLGRVNEALEDYNNANALLLTLKEQGRPFREIDMARILLNRGNTWNVLNDREKALNDYNKSITIKRVLNENGQLSDETELARALLNRGRTYGLLGYSGKALQDYVEAIHLIRSKDEKGKQIDENELIIALIERGNIYKIIGSLEKALVDYNSVIPKMEKLIIEGKYRGEIKISTAWLDRGVILEEIGEIEKALVDYSQVILLLDELHGGIQGETDIDDENLLARAFMNRGNILCNSEASLEALKDYNKAINIMKCLQEHGVLYNKSDLGRTLINRGVIFRKIGDINKSLDDFNDSIVLMLDLKKQDLIIDTYVLASAYLNSALLLADLEFYDDALKDVARSRILLKNTLDKSSDLIGSYFFHLYVNIQLLIANEMIDSLNILIVEMNEIKHNVKLDNQSLHWIEQINRIISR